MFNGYEEEVAALRGHGPDRVPLTHGTDRTDIGWPSPVAALNGALRRVPPWTLYIVGAAWGAWLFWLA
jgi:hypothetical protein